MAHLAAGADGAADPQVVVLIQGISDERVVVTAATTRFAAAVAKSDVLEGNDVSAPSKRARESTMDEDARLQAAYARRKKPRETLAAFGATNFAGPVASSSMLTVQLDACDEADLEEKDSLRSAKRTLVTPKHGWLDAQGKVHQRNFDRHRLLQNQKDILWKV